jgi:hypothetical protein
MWKKIDKKGASGLLPPKILSLREGLKGQENLYQNEKMTAGKRGAATKK